MEIISSRWRDLANYHRGENATDDHGEGGGRWKRRLCRAEGRIKVKGGLFNQAAAANVFETFLEDDASKSIAVPVGHSERKEVSNDEAPNHWEHRAEVIYALSGSGSWRLTGWEL